VNAPASRTFASRKRLAVLLTVAAAVGTFLVFEGVASCLWVVGRLVHAEPVLRERAHCRHDETLGWVQLPGLDLPDQY
jgi:hypothetical protein